MNEDSLDPVIHVPARLRIVATGPPGRTAGTAGTAGTACTAGTAGTAGTAARRSLCIDHRSRVLDFARQNELAL